MSERRPYAQHNEQYSLSTANDRQWSQNKSHQLRTMTEQSQTARLLACLGRNGGRGQEIASLVLNSRKFTHKGVRQPHDNAQVSLELTGNKSTARMRRPSHQPGPTRGMKTHYNMLIHKGKWETRRTKGRRVHNALLRGDTRPTTQSTTQYGHDNNGTATSQQRQHSH